MGEHHPLTSESPSTCQSAARMRERERDERERRDERKMMRWEREREEEREREDERERGEMREREREVNKDNEESYGLIKFPVTNERRVSLVLPNVVIKMIKCEHLINFRLQWKHWGKDVWERVSNFVDCALLEHFDRLCLSLSVLEVVWISLALVQTSKLPRQFTSDMNPFFWPNYKAACITFVLSR